MIKRVLFCILTLSLSLSAANFAPYQTTINKIEKGMIIIDANDDLKVGSSGIVMHAFDDTHKTIIAQATVKSISDGVAKLSYKKYTALKQSALPEYDIKPVSGDTVILNYLYERAMAITPNAEALAAVTRNYNNIEWIHPDIFASYLAIEYSPLPSKSDFQQECKENSFNLLLFAIDERGYFVDCNSFKVLHTTDLNYEKPEKPMVPFYSRIKEVKGRMFGLMGGEGIKDYASYYRGLIGVKK